MCWMDTKTRNKLCCFDHRRRQHQCTQQTHTDLAKETTHRNFTNMSSSWCSKISPLTSIFVCFLLVFSSICPVFSSETGNSHATNQTFRPQGELQKLKIIRERLRKINKPAVKTIKAFDVVPTSSILHGFDFHFPCFCSVCSSVLEF